MEGDSVDLLEKVADNIARSILEKFTTVEELKLRVTKPHVAVQGSFPCFFAFLPSFLLFFFLVILMRCF
jgi:dihydroneopterin aldolase